MMKGVGALHHDPEEGGDSMLPAGVTLASALTSAADFVAAYDTALVLFISLVIGVFALNKTTSLVKKGVR